MEKIAELQKQLDRIEKLVLGLCSLNQDSPNMRNGDYLSVSEVAKLLKITEASIYRHRMNGTLPSRKFGNRLFFPKASILELIEGGRK